MKVANFTPVFGRVPAYAGGSIIARFQKHGGGSPDVISIPAGIDDEGRFALNVWNNVAREFSPSCTWFVICRGITKHVAGATVIHPEDGEPQDISALFADAPTPKG